MTTQIQNNNNLIKSKARIQKHGEVFTPAWVVNDMLNMLPEEVWEAGKTFLEPACGEGAFLIEILKRKLEKINTENQTEWEWLAAIATSSIYGIEILEDNTTNCRKNVLQVFNKFYDEKFINTYRPLETRLNEWCKYFPNLEKQFADFAKADEGTFFRDFAIHYFLENERCKKRLQENTFANLPYFSKEFFENTKIQDVKDAIVDIKDSYLKNNGKYQFYKVNTRLPETHTYSRIENYEPRPNQQETINQFKTALQKE